MNYWLDDSHTRPLVIGHRGASIHAPENTMAAFRLAHSQGADGIEFDIKRCKTGEVVIMHDATVDRTTNGKGGVHTLALAELRVLDAGHGEPVPTLDELFAEQGQLTGPHGKPFLFNVEVTNYSTRDDGLEAAVMALVKRHNIADRVLFSSFNPWSVRKLAQLAPDIPRAILYSPDMPIFLRRVWLAPLVAHQFRHPEKGMIDEAYVHKLVQQHLRVNVWTVNEQADIARMAQYGVHGIIGDSPQTMREVMGR
jgi:glycerophosphoryl diester phosphodiesterase